MTGQDLKNSILQLAIQGKLVPQCADDEPASKLLERIRKEKERLVKEKKIKKEKPLAPITEDEKPFDIPESWEWCRVADISDSYIGLTYRPSDVCENGTVVLRSSNIQNGQIALDDIIKVNLPISEKLTVHEGDILICARNGSAKLVGKSAIINKKADGMSFGAFMAICKTNFYPYVYQFLQSDLFFSQLRLVSGTTTINQLTQKNFNNFILPLPPLAEQQRIVAKIEELMPFVDEYDKAQSELDSINKALPERLKQSILQEAIMGKLGTNNPVDEPASELLARIRKEKAQLIKDKKIKKEKPLPEITDDEKPFEIPENWEWCKMKDLFIIGSARRVHEKDWRTSGIPFYRAREVGKLCEQGYVDNELYIEESLYEEFKKSGYPKGGDLLVSAVGTLGKVYIVKDTDKFYYKDGSVLCFENFSKVNPQYIKYFIGTTFFHDMVYEEAMGTTVATMTMVRANEYLVPLPPLAEQHRIVEKLDSMLPMIENLKLK